MLDWLIILPYNRLLPGVGTSRSGIRWPRGVAGGESDRGVVRTMSGNLDGGGLLRDGDGERGGGGGRFRGGALLMRRSPGERGEDFPCRTCHATGLSAEPEKEVA